MSDRSRTAALRKPFHSHEDLDEDASPGRPPPGLALDPPDAPPPAHPPEIPVDRLDPEALKVIARLRHMRHQAYLVGGCVRDLLLGHTPKDFDVATDAHPGEVRAIFRNCRLIGRRFRLAHVYFRGGKVIEVATFRQNPGDLAAAPEGDEGASEADLLITRDNVFGTAEEDAVRRDFTVNGLFYDIAAGEVIDYVGGRADLEAHRIHTIGDPEVRIREDPVRSLRAVRFASRLGFTIAPDTFEAMRRYAGELARCAPARVLEEIFKILRCGGAARAFQLLRACGALQVILPALGAALDGWDEERRRGFFAHLGALDQLVRSGADVSEAVLLASLVTHLGTGPGAAAPADPQGRSAGREADELLASLVSTSRLPRRVAERVRLALNAQRHFREPPRGRRARKMVGHSYFIDALQLLEIAVGATGRGAELLEEWKRIEDGDDRRPERRERPPRQAPDGEGAAEREPAPAQAEAPAAVPEDGTPQPLEVAASAGEQRPAEPGRKRRRRRGGRRRRRRGVGEGASPGEPEPEAGPQAAGGEGPA